MCGSLEASIIREGDERQEEGTKPGEEGKAGRRKEVVKVDWHIVLGEVSVRREEGGR